MKRYYIILILVLLKTNGSQATEGILKLSLKEAEDQALKTSFSAKVINSEVDASKNKVESQKSFLFPKITLDGSYKYVTEVPTLNFPGGTHMAFGDNQNYSIGPVLTWTVFDFGSIRKSASGFEAQEKSKEAEKSLNIRQILFNVRLAYFKVQLRLEQQRLVTDSLKLAQSQHLDIENRVKAGASNRIDLLSAHKEVLNLKLQSRQIQSDLSSDLRDLYALIGDTASVDSISSIEVDPIDTSLTIFSKYEVKIINEDVLAQHPLIKMHAANAEFFRNSAESLNANLLPKISIFAKTSIDYPNGPVLKSINQNTVGLNLSMPIFEGNRSSSEAAEKQNLSNASESRRDQVRADLVRDWKKANDQLKGLRDKTEIYKNSVSESVERSKLVYSSYRAGRSNFLEVQSSNLHALEVKVQSTTNDVQMLIQLAYLASISEEQ